MELNNSQGPVPHIHGQPVTTEFSMFTSFKNDIFRFQVLPVNKSTILDLIAAHGKFCRLQLIEPFRYTVDYLPIEIGLHGR
jgi:hypothetical protein